jgi:signal transduction histidine kinase
MAKADGMSLAQLPVDRTLARVVLLMRLLGWAWMVAVVLVAVSIEPGASRPVLLGAIALITVGTGLTVLAERRGFLRTTWFAVLDGFISMSAMFAGWLAATGDFVSGGYPISWLFVVAYARNARWTLLAGVVASGVFAVAHVLMDLAGARVAGSIQLVVVALVVGWTFDALRRADRLRLVAETERAGTERALAAEREHTARLMERTAIARSLHDSVLQTLKLISANAEDPSEVRYLARVQERDLRRTISEYQSAYGDSFRARLLDASAMVEDRYRVRIEQVIRADIEMSPRLQTLIDAATEAMANAARHSGSEEIDLFAEITPDGIEVHVRDRGSGFDLEAIALSGISHSILDPVTALGGTAEVKSVPKRGTEVLLNLPPE